MIPFLRREMTKRRERERERKRKIAHFGEDGWVMGSFLQGAWGEKMYFLGSKR